MPVFYYCISVFLLYCISVFLLYCIVEVVIKVLHKWSCCFAVGHRGTGTLSNDYIELLSWRSWYHHRLWCHWSGMMSSVSVMSSSVSMMSSSVSMMFSSKSECWWMYLDNVKSFNVCVCWESLQSSENIAGWFIKEGATKCLWVESCMVSCFLLAMMGWVILKKWW